MSVYTPSYAIEPNDRWFHEAEERAETREVIRDTFIVDTLELLETVAEKETRFPYEEQMVSTLFEAVFDQIFNQVDKHNRFENFLFQIWKKNHNSPQMTEDAQLARLMDLEINIYLNRKAREIYP
jgi:ankyrin repeat protein